MKYIKGIDIKETPVITTTSEGYTITLSDQQLREIGYKPVDEVIMEQDAELMELEPDEDDLKRSLIDNIKVEYPSSGLPFKLGYKWVPRISGDKIIFESIRAESAIGTGNNPIIFIENVLLIPNAYYLYEGERYVYCGVERKTATSWEEIEADMEKF